MSDLRCAGKWVSTWRRWSCCCELMNNDLDGPSCLCRLQVSSQWLECDIHCAKRLVSTTLVCWHFWFLSHLLQAHDLFVSPHFLIGLIFFVFTPQSFWIASAIIACTRFGPKINVVVFVHNLCQHFLQCR